MISTKTNITDLELKNYSKKVGCVRVFDIDSYFTDFQENESVFKNRDVLRPDFIPHKLPHRDIQIRNVAEILACTFKGSTPSNIFIFGKTGTGKTAVVKYVSERLNYNRKKSGISETSWIFLNCQEVNTGYRILAKICNEILPDDKVPIAGWPIDVVFDTALERLEKFVDGYCFLVLDEIDILINKQKKNHDVLYNLARINSKLKSTKVCLIGISNVLDIKKSLDPRVKSSLREEEIIFPAYNAVELKDILFQRSKEAFNEHSLEPSVIPLCGALAAKEHGDARKALDLLRKSGELAERHNKNQVTSDDVYLAQEEIESDKIREYFEKLPLQQKVVFLSVYNLQKAERKTIITGDVYECYCELQEGIPGLNQLTQRSVSDLIKELDLAGLINAQVVSRGRYGRSKVMKMNVSMEDTYKYFSEDKKLSNLLNFVPKVCRKKVKITKMNNFL